MDYDQAQSYIAALAPRGWRLGLDRMRAFAEKAGLSGSLGEPGGPQFIHVTGTNGKGSVTAYVQSVLVEHGLRTGAYFSPYVYDPRERVQFGRSYIERDELARIATELARVAETFDETEFGGVTEFEFKTALGFFYWKQKACDWVALEVGLGGRLDATNIVTPRSSAIVSISLDHTQILGDSVEAIAYEKAGIIKAGAPCVVGDVPEGALRTIEAVTTEVGAPLWRWNQELRFDPARGRLETPNGTFSNLPVGMPGFKQRENVALAIAALCAAGLELAPEAINRGIRSASLPGRLQSTTYRGRSVLLDGAHNPGAAQVLRQSLLAKDQRRLLVTGMVAGHDASAFYRELKGVFDEAFFVPIDFHRGVPPAEVRELAHGSIQGNAYPTLRDGLDAAAAASFGDDLIVIAGSFYLVGEAGRLLGLT